MHQHQLASTQQGLAASQECAATLQDQLREAQEQATYAQAESVATRQASLELASTVGEKELLIKKLQDEVSLSVCICFPDVLPPVAGAPTGLPW